MVFCVVSFSALLSSATMNVVAALPKMTLPTFRISPALSVSTARLMNGRYPCSPSSLQLQSKKAKKSGSLVQLFLQWV